MKGPLSVLDDERAEAARKLAGAGLLTISGACHEVAAIALAAAGRLQQIGAAAAIGSSTVRDCRDGMLRALALVDAVHAEAYKVRDLGRQMLAPIEEAVAAKVDEDTPT